MMKSCRRVNFLLLTNPVTDLRSNLLLEIIFASAALGFVLGRV